jgi:hypothetical protein
MGRKIQFYAGGEARDKQEYRSTGVVISPSVLEININCNGFGINHPM